MLFFSAFPGANGLSTYDDGLAALRTEHAAAAELGAVIDLVFDETRHDALPLTKSLADVPLRVHARTSAKRSSRLSTTPTSSANRPA